MQKDELIQMHSLLLHIRSYLEEKIGSDGSSFFYYDELDVQPQQVFKSKKDQLHAMFELCRGIEQLLTEEETELSQRMIRNLDLICKRLRDE
mgnify:CR=1 FL=1